MGLKDWFVKTKKSLGIKGPTSQVLSLLGPNVVFKHGLSSPAIAGIFRSDDLSPENFVPNLPFIEQVHRVIRERGPTMPGFEQAARRQGSGSLAIIDLRTPEGPEGNVPSEDIVGAFGVVDGTASSATYEPNPHYRVFTRNGLIKLPRPLHLLLMAELNKLAGA